MNQIDVPGTTSAFGICPNHVPTLAVMTPGIVTVFETDGTQKKFFGMSALVILANLSFIILGQLITVHL